MTFSKERLENLREAVVCANSAFGYTDEEPELYKLRGFGEQEIRLLTEAATLLPQYIEALGEARKAMQEFVDKCNRGEARSVRSYAAFTQALSTIHTLSQPQREG